MLKALQPPCRLADERAHLQLCPAGFADLADLVMVVGDKRFPAHSQILAWQSGFIQQLLLDTGHVSWQEPLVISSALDSHSQTAVATLLSCAYHPGAVVPITSASQAWQLYKLADQLNCSAILTQCKEYINSSSGAALVSTDGEALDWISAANELNFDGLKRQCAQKIAIKYSDLQNDPRLRQLPADLLLLILDEMSAYVRDALRTRTGYACFKRHSNPAGFEHISNKMTYHFFL